MGLGWTYARRNWLLDIGAHHAREIAAIYNFQNFALQSSRLKPCFPPWHARKSNVHPSFIPNSSRIESACRIQVSTDGFQYIGTQETWPGKQLLTTLDREDVCDILR